jgi:SpoVK/Ycf46/Vps4 family AAA+-type ATPase
MTTIRTKEKKKKDIDVMTTQPYRNTLEHILDLLSRLDILLNIELIRFQKIQSSIYKDTNNSSNNSSSSSSLQGIAISNEEANEIIENDIAKSELRNKTIIDDSEINRLKIELAEKEKEIEQRVTESLKQNVFLPFVQLISVFSLSWLEIDAITICLALQIDNQITRRYEKLYAYLNDNLMQKNPTVDLLIAIEYDSIEERVRARNAILSKDSPLFRYKMLEFIENDNNYDTYEYPIKIDEHVASFLLGSNTLNARLSSFTKLITPLEAGQDNIILLSAAEEDPLENIKSLLLKTRGKKSYDSYDDNNNNNANKNNSLDYDYDRLFSERRKIIVLNLFGPRGSGRKATAGLVCRNLGCPLLSVDLSEIISEGLPIEESLILTFREALFFRPPAAVYLENFDALLDKNDKAHYSSMKSIVWLIHELSWLTFIETNTLPWSHDGSLDDCFFMSIEFKIPEYKTRKKMWQSIVEKYQDNISNDSNDGSGDNGNSNSNNNNNTLLPRFEENVDFDALASKFAFPPGKIRNSIAFARNLAIARDDNNTITTTTTADATTSTGIGRSSKITMDDLYRGCKSQSNQGLTNMAKKIHLNYAWNDIVLPPAIMALLKDICNVVKYKGTVFYDWGFSTKFSLGKGLTALFTGESGTGKTMAAEVIANDLNLELYKIDLSSILSKYIGETEKNLNTIFKESEGSNSILFFDEADALFGKRTDVKDSHDRYANIETNYLLQKIDEFEGVVILSTNYRRNIDEAFIRRMQFIVNFPFPDAEYRLVIWKKAFPKQVPRSDDIDFKFLANNLQVPGGNIKNIVINSAFIAAKNGKRPISMSDIILATKREFDKIGKPIQKSDFGKYSAMLDDSTNTISTTPSAPSSRAVSSSSSENGM